MTLKDKILKSVLGSEESSSVPEDMERSEALLQLSDLDEESKQRIRENELANSVKRYGSNSELDAAIEPEDEKGSYL